MTHAAKKEQRERDRARREEEIQRLRKEAAKTVDPKKVRKSAMLRLAKLIPASVLLGLLSCSGGQLDPKAQRAIDTFQCYVAVVTPYIGEVCDVTELVRNAIQGKANLQQALVLLGTAPDELDAINRALKSCLPIPPAPLEPEPPEYTPARVVAPPPQYGHRLL